MARIFRKIVNKIKNGNAAYYRALKQPIDMQLVLLEAGQGKNINGNMFAFVREFCTNPQLKQMHVVFVVTDDTLEAAKKRFNFYNYTVELVVRGSKRYQTVLGRAKYLITDNSFPPYMDKREDQIYLNTWHGTPLKTLGKSDIKNAKSLANIQKNYLMCDYALFPNTFTKDVFMNDYMLRHLYKGDILLCDYPRNEIFLNQQWIQTLRNKLHLENKKCIAYMPTWRGSSRSANIEKQMRVLENYFKLLDKQLSGDEIFFVNLHFLVGNQLDYTKYKHIQPFPSDYETYDFLSCCDVLVTDYSSVFFDFAILQKPIILFAYDLEDYMNERGTYFPMPDLPFPIVKDIDALIQTIRRSDGQTMDQTFLDTYCKYRSKHITKDVISLLLGNKTSLHLEKNPEVSPSLTLVYGGNLRHRMVKTHLLETINQCLKQHPQNDVVLAFSSNITKNTIEFLNQLPSEVGYMAMVKKNNFSPLEHVMAWLDLKYGIALKKVKTIYQRECHRLFYRITPDTVIYYPGQPKYIAKILAQMTGHRIAHIQPDAYMGLGIRKRGYRHLIRYFKAHYDEVIDHRQDDISEIADENKQQVYNALFKVVNLWNFFRNTKKDMRLYSLTLIRSTYFKQLSNYHITVGSFDTPSKIYTLLKIGRYHRLCFVKVAVPYDLCKELTIQNPVRLVATDNQGYGIEKPIGYKLKRFVRKRYLKGPIYTFKESETAAYFRQSEANTVYFTVRKSNHTDKLKEQWKLRFAYYLSKILPITSLIILFEKESSRYEESASVLYEKLIDQGVNHAYFILDFNYPYLNEIPMKYRQNLICKGSFKHYLYFFKSTTFFGSESLVHAIDLRIANKYAQKKLSSRKNRYVFLQHGVMYMVSLDSESRKFFKPNRRFDTYRVVVSSKEEARHFIELGGYREDDLYITGLPKFDKNKMDKDADKIVIMPTWRPWEYNDARYDFKQTKYYQMIERIYQAIPEHYHNQVVILPHPLFYDAAKDADFSLKAKMDITSKYDDILKKTKILITDYSSIAYDVFYRGANVIFYWEEKDECLENYGPTTKLMLDEGNSYGDICMNSEDLTAVFEKNYCNPQDQRYIERYKALVTYNDGCNTERLIECLRQDHLI